MQTFLPYRNFIQSAEHLDWRRLGKQRVEAMQILNALKRGEGGWYNHPATKMWRGYEDALGLYMNAMINEWVRRGYNNTMELYCDGGRIIDYPKWLGDEAFHASHRAALLYKAPEWYNEFNWTEEPKLAYIWPGGV
jgi:hypothetical protein